MHSMAIDRRHFLAGAGAVLLAGATRPAFAAGQPRYLSAAATLDGRQVAVALAETGEALYDLDLADRGHGLALRPGVGEAVCFGRRPGAYAQVFDLAAGDPLTTITPTASDRHFSGHGVFTPDGRYLLLTENDMTRRRGLIGVHDATADYARVREFATGGIGPHDLRLLPDGLTLVVANGGLDHRHDQMNAAEMADIQSDLVYLDWQSGALLDQVKLDPALSRMSIRHLALTADGQVVAALQDSAEVPDLQQPLGFLHRRGENLRWLATPAGGWGGYRGYCGSAAVDLAGGLVAMSSPRGNCVGLWSAADGSVAGGAEIHDGCGLAAAAAPRTLLVSSGGGDLFTLADGAARATPLGGDAPAEYRFDNHLLRINS